jgi:hypothetical protein
MQQAKHPSVSRIVGKTDVSTSTRLRRSGYKQTLKQVPSPAPTGAAPPITPKVCPAIELTGLKAGAAGADTMGTYVFMGITELGRPVYVLSNM